MTESCSPFVQLFIAAGLAVGEYRCPGTPAASDVEAAPHPEIVLPRIGAYIREDEAGAVYLDRTVVAFFEAGRPYTIRHLKPRPDLTTVISLTNAEAIKEALNISLPPGRVFPRSAIRATPPIQQLHRMLVKALGEREVDALSAAEAAATLTLQALELASADSIEITNRLTAKEARWRHDLCVSIAEYLNAHYARRLTLDEIAAYSGYSVFHVCRMFRAQMGTTLHAYLASLKLEAAMAALLDTEQTVTELAHGLGFSSHSHFTTQFKKRYGVAPLEARRMARR